MQITDEMKKELRIYADNNPGKTHAVVYDENVPVGWDYRGFSRYTDAQAFTIELTEGPSEFDFRIINLVTL